MMFASIPSFTETILRALALDASIFTAIQTSPQGLGVALIVILLAGLSEATGQSIVLFLNQVTPRRFSLTLIISAVSHFAGFVLWAAIIWLIGRYLFDRDLPMLAVASTVGLAYAPRLFSFFVLTPFFGNMFSLLLSLWSLLAIVIAIQAGLHMTLWQAVAASGLGWLLVQLWQRTLGRPIYAVDAWLKRRAAGVPMQFTLRDVSGMRRERSNVWEQWRAYLEESPNPFDSIKLDAIPPLPPVSTSKLEKK